LSAFSIFLHNVFIRLYYAAARILALFDSKARKWVKGRKTVWEELQKLPVSDSRVWFHCASLGEYEQALPLIEKLRAKSSVLVTFYSPSGYEVVKKKNPEAQLFYLPLDTKSNARKFMDIAQPSLAIFVRYDLWYYYLNELKQRSIRSFLISAVYHHDAVFFRWYGTFFRGMLQCFTHIFVQDENSKTVLNENGFQNVTKAGDTRIDRVAAIAQNAPQFPLIEKFKGDRKLFIIGSLEPKDEPVALPLIHHPAFKGQFRFIIAPHDTGKKSVERLTSLIKNKTSPYSACKAETIAENEVVLIDSIGMLSRLYAFADIAYIGGGFGEGLHNVLEPAVWGVPVLFGPKHRKFIEAVELLQTGGAFCVNNAEEAIEKTAQLCSCNELLKKAGSKAEEYIRDRKGATEIILRAIG